MTKASDNAFPSILITEGTEPSAPAAGKQRLYIDSTTHLLKATNSSGTDRTIEGVPAGAVTSSGLTMATARLLGRTTASTGAIEEITVGSGLSLSAGSLTATGAAAFSGCKVTRSAVQTLSDNTLTAIQWDQESYDTDAYHDNASNNTRLIAPATGYYLVEATLKWAVSTAGTQRYADIYQDGTTVRASTNAYFAASGVAPAINHVAVVQLNSTQYVELRMYQDTGGNLDTGNSSGFHASISRIG